MEFGGYEKCQHNIEVLGIKKASIEYFTIVISPERCSADSIDDYLMYTQPF